MSTPADLEVAAWRVLFGPDQERHLPGLHDQKSHGRRGPKALGKKALQAAQMGQAALDAIPLGRGSGGIKRPESAALSAYTRPEVFRTINGDFRGDLPPDVPPPSAATRKTAAHIDQVMKRSKTTGRIEVWRGMWSGAEQLFGEHRMAGNLKGLKWREKAYSSTSVRKSAAQEFAGDGLLLRIQVLAGVGAAKLEQREHDGEGEVLLDRELDFEVIADYGIDRDWGYRLLDVEVVP